ncbi:hypothetical protein [Salinigranum halophilum]|uniref:hypothetical protein n=1 Tax=Salinigranum halophilum TaxID=2565931 RepID=UPI00115DB3D6|nr:hypothetical protein [Salinigranum halophilum]
MSGDTPRASAADGPVRFGLRGADLSRARNVTKAVTVVPAGTESHERLGSLGDGLKPVKAFDEHGDGVTVVFDGDEVVTF